MKGAKMYVNDEWILVKVRECLKNNSGGMKFIQLVSELMEAVIHEKLEVPDFVNHVEKLLRSLPDIKVLDYSWHYAPGEAREKMFVYTP